jgi:hypothetical protein
MEKFSLSFRSSEYQKQFFAAAFGAIEPAEHPRVTATIFTRIADFVRAFGPGQVPVMFCFGAATWVVLIVSTGKRNPNIRHVRDVFVFQDSQNHELAKAVAARFGSLVEEIKYASGELRDQLRRKLTLYAALIEPQIPMLFSCEADWKLQVRIMREIDSKVEDAVNRRLVSASPTLLDLGEFIGRFQSLRVSKRVSSDPF